MAFGQGFAYKRLFQSHASGLYSRETYSSNQRPGMTQPQLKMVGISKRFGATRALRDVSFQARPGQVLALIGENGAGKSTLMKILSGAHAPDAGSMQLDGSPYAPCGPHDAREAGVAMIYQELNLAPELSIADNVMLGQEHRRFVWLNRASQYEKVRSVLRLLGHPNLDLEMPVKRLSIAAQQLVEIARALVLDARVLIFDEPTSSLTRHDVVQLFEVIGRLKSSGRTIIYISHFLEEVREVCDHFTVLRDGQVAGSGDLDEVAEKELVGLMVGRTVDELFPTVPHQPGEIILTLDGLSGARSPNDVSFQLRRGEILGLAGLVGAGRTELLRAVYALDAVRAGKVQVGELVPAETPRGRMRAGLGYVSEDRKGEGLAQTLSIDDNVTLSRLKPYSRAGWLALDHRRATVRQWMDKLQIKARASNQTVETLSGGNQQKVAIARVLHQDADVLLLDEPTRGIDVGTKSEIYKIIGQLAADGKAVIFVSAYLPELLAVCDRVGVMSRGRLREIRAARDWTEESVMACAVDLDEQKM